MMTVAEVLGAFRDLPLPVRMRAAADVIEELEREHFDKGLPGSFYLQDPSRDLRDWADDRENENAAGKEQAVRELAEFIRGTDGKGFNSESLARRLIDTGWTRLIPDE